MVFLGMVQFFRKCIDVIHNGPQHRKIRFLIAFSHAADYMPQSMKHGREASVFDTYNGQSGSHSRSHCTKIGPLWDGSLIPALTQINSLPTPETVPWSYL